MLFQIQSLATAQLQLMGGATESIFPQVEALLTEGDHFAGLQFIASPKKMSGYRSVVDFLFCELHQEWRAGCRRYYAGMGKPLREMIGVEEIFEYNKRMLIALDLGATRYQDRRRQSWPSFVLDVEDSLYFAS